MAALARHVPLDEMLAMYRGMLRAGGTPDAYTYNAMLTNMVATGAPLHVVEDMVGEMRARGVRANTHLGTTLVNAYKRCPEMAAAAAGDSAAAALLLEKAHDVLSSLASQRLANAHTYGTVMSMHAQLGDAAGVSRLLARMQTAGVPLDEPTLATAAKSCTEAGLVHMAEHLSEAARQLAASRGGGGGGGAHVSAALMRASSFDTSARA
eukprot:353852-Chlamydomonas_euryale.AAC.1